MTHEHDRQALQSEHQVSAGLLYRTHKGFEHMHVQLCCARPQARCAVLKAANPAIIFMDEPTSGGHIDVAFPVLTCNIQLRL